MHDKKLTEELKKHCEFAVVGADGDVECECMCGRNILVGCAYQKKDYNPDGLINVVFCTRIELCCIWDTVCGPRPGKICEHYLETGWR